MEKRRNRLPIVVLFVILSLIVIVFAHMHLFDFFIGALSSQTNKIEQALFHFSQNDQTQSALVKENATLQSQVADMDMLKKENEALRDQFQLSDIPSKQLLPANVIGAPHFLPGISEIETLVLDKGSNDGAVSGQAVIFKDNLIGKLTTVLPHSATVLITTAQGASFPAKTLRGNVLGIADGGNGGILLHNVLPTGDIKTNDIVVTYGGVDENGKGIWPNLIIGKIHVVNKQPSALFQSAAIDSLVDFQSLSTVFITLPKK